MIELSHLNRKAYEKHIASLNRTIEATIRKEASEAKSTIKLLMLGAAECGKSTVIKQMRILHNNGFSEVEVELQRKVIFGNIINAMVALMDAMDHLNIPFVTTDRKADAEIVRAAHSQRLDDVWMTLELSDALQCLWADEGIQKCFARSNEFQLCDSTQYFFDNLSRISAGHFVPTQQDILRARVATNGVVEMQFKIKGAKFRVIDVGGQRSQRKKWIHCFEDVDSLIFIVAISEYDQKLAEDSKTNRIHEAMALFSSIINCRYFSKKNIILFLNKIDLFEQKLKRTPITVAFPKYKGNQEYEECAQFMESMFIAMNNHSNRSIFLHQTCATDTEQLDFVLDAVLNTIMEANLKASGFSS